LKIEHLKKKYSMLNVQRIAGFQDQAANLPDIFFRNGKGRRNAHAIGCKKKPVCKQSICKAIIDYFFID